MPPKIALMGAGAGDGGFAGFLWFYARILVWTLAAAGFVLLAGLQFRQIGIVWSPPDQSENVSTVEAVDQGLDASAMEIKGPAALFSEQTFVVDPTKTYRLSADIRVLPKSDGSLTASVFYLGVQTFDKYGEELRSGPGTYRYAGADSKIVGSEQGWVHVEGEITGEGDENHKQFRPGTHSVKLVLLPNYRLSDDIVLRIRNLGFSERITFTSKTK